jgi:hypothetical protein
VDIGVEVRCFISVYIKSSTSLHDFLRARHILLFLLVRHILLEALLLLTLCQFCSFFLLPIRPPANGRCKRFAPYRGPGQPTPCRCERHATCCPDGDAASLPRRHACCAPVADLASSSLQQLLHLPGLLGHHRGLWFRPSLHVHPHPTARLAPTLVRVLPDEQLLLDIAPDVAARSQGRVVVTTEEMNPEGKRVARRRNIVLHNSPALTVANLAWRFGFRQQYGWVGFRISQKNDSELIYSAIVALSVKYQMFYSEGLVTRGVQHIFFR